MIEGARGAWITVQDAMKLANKGWKQALKEDPALLRTMFFLWERLKVVVEPTGALGAAALLEGALAAQLPWSWDLSEDRRHSFAAAVAAAMSTASSPRGGSATTRVDVSRPVTATSPSESQSEAAANAARAALRAVCARDTSMSNRSAC